MFEQLSSWVKSLFRRPGNVSVASYPGSGQSIEDLDDVSITTPTVGQYLRYNGALWDNEAGGGEGGTVTGPGSATDTAVAIWDGSGGDALKNSTVIIDDGDINIATGKKYKINNVALAATDVGAEPTLTKGDLSVSTPLVATATRQVIGGELLIEILKATGSQDGYLDNADWTTFNSKADYLFGSNGFTGTGSFSTNNSGSFSTINLTEGLVLPKTTVKGVKVDNDSPTFAWRDIIGDITPKTTAAGAATLAVFYGGVYRAFFYGANDLCDMVFHLPHDYVEGTDIFLHLHWAHNGTAISGSLVVDFGISYAKGHNQANFITEVAPVLTVNTPNISTIPQYRHRIEEIQMSSSTPTATQLDSSALEVDGLILVGLKVDTIPTITGGSTNLPAFLTLDLHYQSTNIGTKQKAPPFYV